MKATLNITAHTGCDGTTAGSLESILSGQKAGADAVEVDVRINNQGQLVLSHDEDASHMYTGYRFLEEAFGIIVQDGSLAINCDVKEAETIPHILRLAEKMGISSAQLILTGSGRPSMIRNNPDIARKSQVWFNIEEIIEDYYRTGSEFMRPYRHLINPETHRHEILKSLSSHFEAFIDPMIRDCKALGVKAINMPCTEQTAPLIPTILSKGIQVSLWTINDEERLRKLLNLGVMNITTRTPRLAVNIRQSMLG